MKNKLLILSLITGIFAVGCSESAYTPTNGVPLNNTAGNMYPNGINPALNPGMNPGFNPGFQNNYQNMNYPMYQQQNMLSWQMRMSLPGFYYNNYQYRSCIPRKPYVTTCNQRVVRNPCPVVVTHHTCTSCTDVSVNTNTDTSVNTNTDVVVTTGDDTTKVYPISWKDEDAQALYDRLAKEEVTLDNRAIRADVKARTGENVKCIVDGKEGNAKNYVCDVEIRAKDGMLLQQTPVGKDAAPETAVSFYKGDLLNIGIQGLAPEMGYLVVAGPVAKQLYANLATTEVAGKIAEAGNLDAKIKTLGQVKCYSTTNSTTPVTECILKINSITGAAVNF